MEAKPTTVGRHGTLHRWGSFATAVAVFDAPAGTFSPATVRRGSIILAGVIKGSAGAVGYSPWIAPKSREAEFFVYECRILVDDVVVGDAHLVGKLIPFRYIAIMDMEAPLLIRLPEGMPEAVGKHRCLVELEPVGTDHTFRTVGAWGYMALGMKPEGSSTGAQSAEDKLTAEIASAMKDDDPNVADPALLAACRFPSMSKAVEALMWSRTRSKDALRAASAWCALAIRGNVQALYKLEDLLAGSNHDERIAAIVADAVKNLSAQDAVPVLVKLSTYPDPQVRLATTYALRGVQSYKSISALAAALGDTDARVRYNVIQALYFQTGEVHDDWAPDVRQLSEEPWLICR